MPNRIETTRFGSHKKYETFKKWSRNYNIDRNIFTKFEGYWRELLYKKSIRRITVKDRDDNYRGEKK